ncbi:uncharacterized protein LOC130988418 [Salvia miltiorrhiza]|uniref:uncharacterized protein LOC130988418 n=1 Tax=Salvia miltiorrhiza TaxID=226208 RepID=UPI0025ACDA14|nr:uncharacterized protein LOC130988418 [Salvia miltiorrhiza]
MTEWKNVLVRYGGYWNDVLYCGGGATFAYVQTNNISISELRQNINYYLMANSLSTVYNLYYLSRSRSGRIIRSLLSTDDQLSRLCAFEVEPEVYVTHDGGTSQSEQEVYRPSIEIPYASTYEHPPQPTSFEEPISNHMRGFDWFADNNDDEEYVPSTDTDDEEDEDDEEAEERESARVDYGTFAEHIAWIRREGGIGQLMSMIMQTNPQRLEEELGPEQTAEMSNWLVPVVPKDFSVNLFAGKLDNIPDPDELSEGSIFESKEELKLAVGLWHLERRAEFVIPRSDLDRITFKCRYRTQCPFLLRATQHGDFWMVRKFGPAHTCTDNLVNIGVRKVPARVIAAYIAKKMREDGDIVKPRSIVVDLQREYGVQTSYSVEIRPRNMAVEMIYGGHKESYGLLPGYLHMLRMCNPGSVTDLEVDENDRLKHLFVALGSCRVAYTMCMRPIIVVDGTHLKGRNKGVLFVAVTKDDNEQVFPMAFGIGPIENDESWKLFFYRLKAAYGQNSETLIVSDAHISIQNAVKEVYPHAAHGLCYYHLLNKITRYGKAAVAFYQKAAYAYRESDFDKAMASLKALNEDGGAYTKLMQVGPERWARSKCPVRRYSFLTSNVAESFNSRLLWARRLPICSMVEAIRHIIEK